MVWPGVKGCRKEGPEEVERSEGSPEGFEKWKETEEKNI